MKTRVLLLLLTSFSCVARADNTEKAALEEAKKVAKQASIQYQLGNFTDAADLYSKSYTLSPVPGLLFNLGQTQMMLKQYDRALFFFEGYLRDKPDAPNATLVQDLIAESKREIAAKKAHEAAIEEERLAAARVVPPPPPPPSPPPIPRRTLKLRGAAIFSGLGGLTLGGISVALGLRSEIAKGDAANAPAGSALRNDFDHDRRAYLISAAVIGSLGAAALVSSGVLAYFGWRHPRTQVAAAPLVGGGGLVTVGGGF